MRRLWSHQPHVAVSQHRSLPAVKRWLAVHHEPSNFHYLIGSTRQLAPVWKAFYVSPQTRGDPINHRGHLAALIPAGVPINTNDLAHDLGVLTTAT